MKYIVLPLEDAKILFTDEELETHRKSVDGTKVIMHEETLIEKRNALGLSTLPSEDTGQIEWTYPNYDYGTDELNKLLSSSEWNSDEVQQVQTMSVASTSSATKTTTNKSKSATSKSVDKSYWNF